MSEEVTEQPWYRPWPDLTTEVIIRIDEELERTRQARELIAKTALCVTCGEYGMHAHWIGARP